MSDAEVLSQILLQLYQAARSSSVEDFQRHSMELLGRVIPFDNGWWGRATFDGAAHRVHCSYLYRLPKDVPDLLNVSDPNNLVALRTTQMPDQAHCFGPLDWAQQASTAALASHMGIQQALCIAHPSESQSLVSFFSIARHEADPVFNAREQHFLEQLMPHLAAALDLCCITQMGQLHKGDEVHLLTTDADGWLHATEIGVRALLLSEWPHWTSPRLPGPLTDAISKGQSIFSGRHLQADIRWSGEHAQVALRRRGPRDLLTRQEYAVADTFASGQSYKEVAQKMNLAPSTVRHHLRSAYLKLGVSDKAALAHCLK